MTELVITEQTKALIRQIVREEVKKILAEEVKSRGWKPGPQEHK